MAPRHDHAAGSVATLRAELAALRPRLAQAERDRDDARRLGGLMELAALKAQEQRDEARGLLRQLHDLYTGSLLGRMENDARVMGMVRDELGIGQEAI